jgi:hypothetical protein
MAPVTSQQGLRWFVTVLGAVALVAGTASVVLGLASIPAVGPIHANADSELRFYAVWYAAAGLVLLRSAPKIEAAGTVVRGAAWAFFAAGSARAVSWLVYGRPHWSQVVLMALELAMPMILVPWQRSVESGRRRTPSSEQ